MADLERLKATRIIPRSERTSLEELQDDVDEFLARARRLNEAVWELVFTVRDDVYDRIDAAVGADDETSTAWDVVQQAWRRWQESAENVQEDFPGPERD